MKKLVVVMLILSLVSLSCGDTKVIEGKKYDTFGIFCLNKQNPDIEYGLIIGNVIWSVILIQTIVFPLYFIGWSIYEPIGLKATYEKGVIDESDSSY